MRQRMHPFQAACVNFKWQQALGGRVADFVAVVGQAFGYLDLTVKSMKFLHHSLRYVLVV